MLYSSPFHTENEKTREDIEREGNILAEMLSILEQKEALVTLLEEDRQRCEHNHHHSPSTAHKFPHSTSTTAAPFASSIQTLSFLNITDLALNPDDLTPALISALAPYFIPESQPYDVNPGSTTVIDDDLSSDLKSLTQSLSLNERQSHFSHLPKSRRPSVFDLDPCSYACTHARHAHKKVNLFGRARRSTHPDITLTQQRLILSHPSHTDSTSPHRRLSLSFPFPLHLGSREGHLQQCDFFSSSPSTLHSDPVSLHTSVSQTSFLNTVCSYALIVVLSLWFLPQLASFVSHFFCQTYSGIPPF